MAATVAALLSSRRSAGRTARARSTKRRTASLSRKRSERAAHRPRGAARDRPGAPARRGGAAARGWWPAPAGGAARQEDADEVGGAGQQVLAVVEQQQRLPGAQSADQLLVERRDRGQGSRRAPRRPRPGPARDRPAAPDRPRRRHRRSAPPHRRRSPGPGASCRPRRGRSGSGAARPRRAACARRGALGLPADEPGARNRRNAEQPLRKRGNHPTCSHQTGDSRDEKCASIPWNDLWRGGAGPGRAGWLHAPNASTRSRGRAARSSDTGSSATRAAQSASM